MKTRSIPRVLPVPCPEMTEEVQDFELPRLLLLPRTISENAKILTLPHPRTAEPTRYYFCPESGIYEFTRIAAPISAYRSLLITPTLVTGDKDAGLPTEQKTDTSQSMGICTGQEQILKSTTRSDNVQLMPSKGYISKTAESFTVTPVDPLFLLLPMLHPKPSNSKSEESRGLFKSLEDLFDDYCEISEHFKQLSNHKKTRYVLESRIRVICDIVQAGDENMYRFNIEKLLKELVSKSRRMVSSGLPASMEEKFIRKALEMPMTSIKRQESSMSENAPDDDTVTELPTPRTIDSQSSTSTSLTNTSQSSESTNITIPEQLSPPNTSDQILDLLRLRTALSYLTSAYLPRYLATTTTNLLASAQSPIDFQPLNTRLSEIAALRAEALASRSTADFGRKRDLEDDEAAEIRAEKRLKKEEEEKRKKAGVSRGVRDLKKVDTTGMKKMSDFFGKKGVVVNTKKT